MRLNPKHSVHPATTRTLCAAMQAVQVAQEDNSRLLVELAEQLSSLQGAGTAAPGLLASDFAAGAAHGAWRAHAAQQLQHEAQQLECLPAFSGWLQVVVDSAEGLAPGEALAARVACCRCVCGGGGQQSGKSCGLMHAAVQELLG